MEIWDAGSAREHEGPAKPIETLPINAATGAKYMETTRDTFAW